MSDFTSTVPGGLRLKRQDCTFGAKTEAGRILAAAWCEAAGDALLPRRSRLTPRALKEIIELIYIMEYLAPDNVRFRLAGSRLGESLGFQLTGLNNIELVPPAQRPVRIARYAECAARPCGMRYAAPARLASGQKTLIENMILPVLPDRDGDPLQFIAVAAEVEKTEFWPGDTMVEVRTYNSVQEHIDFLDVGSGVPDKDPGLPLLPR